MNGFQGAGAEALRQLAGAVTAGAERIEAARSPEEPERIRLGTDMNCDRDPGSFDGVGGIDADSARLLAARVGEQRLPDWVRELLAGS